MITEYLYDFLKRNNLHVIIESRGNMTYALTIKKNHDDRPPVTFLMKYEKKPSVSEYIENLVIKIINKKIPIDSIRPFINLIGENEFTKLLNIDFTASSKIKGAIAPIKGRLTFTGTIYYYDRNVPDSYSFQDANDMISTLSVNHDIYKIDIKNAVVRSGDIFSNVSEKIEKITFINCRIKSLDSKSEFNELREIVFVKCVIEHIGLKSNNEYDVELKDCAINITFPEVTLINATLININDSKIISLRKIFGSSPIYKLKYFYISNVNITDFEGIPPLPSLEILSVRETKITSFKGLPKILPKLKTLHAYNNENLTSFEHFPKCPMLFRLSIGGNFKYNGEKVNKFPFIHDLHMSDMDGNFIKALLPLKFLTSLHVVRPSEPFDLSIFNDIHPSRIRFVDAKLYVPNKITPNVFSAIIACLRECKVPSVSFVNISKTKLTKILNFVDKHSVKFTSDEERYYDDLYNTYVYVSMNLMTAVINLYKKNPKDPTKTLEYEYIKNEDEPEYYDLCLNFLNKTKQKRITELLKNMITEKKPSYNEKEKNRIDTLIELYKKGGGK